MQHVELGDLSADLNVLTSGEPCLLIGAHCGNWELLGFTLAIMGFPMTAIARPLDNVYLNDWLLSLRERRGLRVLTKWGVTDQINTLITGDDPAGRRIGFIADQNAGERGLFVPFLGKLASSYKSIGLLAMHHNVPIIAGYARRIGDKFRYRLEVVDRFGPEDWSDQPDPLFYITARFNRAIEQMVERSPEQYLWIHRRWKSRPKWEREGKEMPASLRSRLEGLPWMNQTELDRLLCVEPRI
jgi:KDO2-lipid IV(A) lauroyltransferase